MSKVIILSVLVALVVITNANDIRLGFATPQSRKIYSEIKEANPALWQRTDSVDIQGVGNEVINAVYITDLRDDKDGEAFIQSGGIGMKSVTIGLKSPTILRGYKFLIEVFANDPTQNQRYFYKGGYTNYNDDIQYGRKF